MKGEPAVSRRPFDPPGVVLRIAPFVAAAVLAFVALVLPPENKDKTPIIAAFSIMGVVVASSLFIPWRKLPAWAQIFPPLTFFFVVVLLREAEGGAISGYS